jgi:DNA repair protein RecO
LQERLDFSLRIAFMADILEKFTGERDANADLFRLVYTVLDEMEKDLAPDVGSLYFTLWLLRISGLLGSLNECAACGTRIRGGGLHYRTDQPGFFCRRCGGPFGRPVTAPAQAGFLEILRRHPGQLRRERFTAGALKQMKQMLYDLVSAHAEAELKSLKLLKEIEANIL